MSKSQRIITYVKRFLWRLCYHMPGHMSYSIVVYLAVSLQDHDYLNSRKRGMSKRLTRDLPLVKLFNISITLSPFLGVDTTQFHTSLIDGTEAYWLSLPSAPQGQLVRSVILSSTKRWNFFTWCFIIWLWLLCRVAYFMSCAVLITRNQTQAVTFFKVDTFHVRCKLSPFTSFSLINRSSWKLANSDNLQLQQQRQFYNLTMSCRGK